MHQVRNRWRGRHLSILLAAIASIAACHLARADVPFGVMVERIGGTSTFTAGTAAGAATTSLFLDNFSFSGSGTLQTPQDIVALPTADATGVRALTDVTGTSSGYMQKSVNGQYLLISGHDLAPGSTVVTASPGGVRGIGLYNLATGALDTRAGWQTTGTPRAVASTDGTSFYYETGSGLDYLTTTVSGGLLTATSQAHFVGNQRTTSIYGGQLFVSGTDTGKTSISGTAPGVSTIGAGLPTSVPATPYDNYIMTTGANPEQFVMLDLNASNYVAPGSTNTGLDTTYVATDNGVEKWTFNGTSWVLAYAANTNGTGKETGGLKGVAFVGLDNSGNPILFGTTAGNTLGNALMQINDTGAGFTYTQVAESPDNSFFRGVQLVPEPGIATLMLSTAMLLGGRRKRRRAARCFAQ